LGLSIGLEICAIGGYYPQAFQIFTGVKRMAWWLWIVLGLVLLVGEILTPGAFFMLFFGLGGLIMGLILLVGVPLVDWMQWFGFSLISVGLLAFFRQRLKDGCMGGKPISDVDSFIGQRATVTVQMTPNSVGQIELRGTVWSAKNIGQGILSVGSHCTVSAVDGLTLHVQGE
jgi:membrane protein implicated in regulation of membrane protease activity